MRTRRLATCLLLAVSIGLFAAPAPAGDAMPATKAYLDYNAALDKANRLEDVLPMLSSAYRQMLESRPKSDRPEWLKRLKETLMKDTKITSESVSTDGKTATLLATGTSGMGNAMKGKITMVLEGGAWKLDGQGWSMSR